MCVPLCVCVGVLVCVYVDALAPFSVKQKVLPPAFFIYMSKFPH